MMRVDKKLKMLVLFLLILYTVSFCEGKAFREEGERGKRLYNHDQSAGLHETYDPQSNAEHLMKGKFYTPEVAGQPIYVPALDQPGSYNEFLDAYYKAYTTSWNLETPAPKVYGTANIYKTPGKTVVSSSGKDNKYGFSVPKESFSIEMDTPEVRNDLEVIDKSVMTELSSGKSDLVRDESEEFEEPILRVSLKKSDLPKTKPKDGNKYEQPLEKTVQKPKTNAETDAYKKPNTQKIKPQVDKKPDITKYALPVPKERPFSFGMDATEDYAFESEDYDDPEVIDKTVVNEFSNTNSDLVTDKSKDLEEFEEPILRESLKKPVLPQNKPTDKEYEQPVVIKSVKQKSKTKPPKKTNAEKPTKPQLENADNYEKPSSGKYSLPNPQESRFSVEMSASEDYDLSESEDNDPTIIEENVGTESINLNSDFVKGQLKGSEESDESVLQESLKKPQLLKSKPTDSNKYEQPIIKVVNQKLQPYVKDSPEKLDTPKTKPQLENADYDKPVVHKIVKVKPNKIETKVSTPRYGDRTSQATRKKSKGKRRKQSSKSNIRTGEDSIDREKMFDPITVPEKPDELSKDNSELYPLQGSPIKVKDKIAMKTDPENKPGKTGVVAKSDSQYKTKKTTRVPVRKNKHKSVKTDKVKPVKTNENVVKTDPQYQFVQTKENVVIKSDSKAKPTETKGIVKYDTEVLEQGNLLRQLDDQTGDSAEEAVINTGGLLEGESGFESSLDMTESNLPENMISSISTELKDDQKSEISNDTQRKPGSVFPEANYFRGLSSMNSNIWSMLFNPNAEQNRLKQKRCITRSNETGFCTYIQNCEVPHIATSLEKLLNNACVIDDIFIGVCCPEFPVQTVQVHWDQAPSDFDNQIEDEFGHNAEDCGIKSNEASEQSWPWKAPLVSMSNGKIFCGGVIVSEDHVLTAAHCTTKIPKNQILVRLGQYDDESGDDYAVVQIKRHAQYNPRLMHNDVALLKLGRRIMHDANIGIACLPDEEHTNNHEGETATLLGWRGIFGTKSRDPEFLKVISNKECENRMGMKVPGTLLCTETRKESERTCNADSGAPLIIQDDGRYEVIGILSWNRNDCNQRFPSTYSRVSSYAGWIKNHIA